MQITPVRGLCAHSSERDQKSWHQVHQRRRPYRAYVSSARCLHRLERTIGDKVKIQNGVSTTMCNLEDGFSSTTCLVANDRFHVPPRPRAAQERRRLGMGTLAVEYGASIGAVLNSARHPVGRLAMVGAGAVADQEYPRLASSGNPPSSFGTSAPVATACLPG